MKNKITLLFAALMMTLGVSAQEGTTVEERGAEKGYYPFAAEITGMEKLTSLDQIENGMEIMIKHSHEGTSQADHEGLYLTIYSLNEGGDGGYHQVFMQEKPVGVGVWTTDAVGDGSYRLKTAHMTIVDGAICYLGSPNSSGFYTTKSEACTYEVLPTTDGRWTLYYTNVIPNAWGGGSTTSKGYLCVTSTDKGIQISSSSTLTENCYFEIYRVTEKSEAQVKYVEDVQVHLIGPSGNIVTTTHTGWNDFYEFIMYSGSAQNSVNYGISISNVLYHENQNQITASIKYAFPISGNVAKIPVHLCPMGSENLRISIVDGNLKVVEKPANGWVKDKNNQWYIFPRYDNQDFTYAIKNVGTGQYINFTEGSRDITLSETPTYFTLGANTAGTYLNFDFKYNDRYTYCLYGSNVEYVNPYNASNSIPAYKVHTFDKSTSNSGKNFLVPAVSAAELDGKPAIGFTRYFHEDTYFWDGGEIADEKVPDAVKANRGSTSHEGYNKGTHKVYSAETGIIVTQTGTVTAQFDYISGQNALQILGVDIVTKDANNTVVSFDYHLGKAGTPSQGNLYLLENVEEGEYLLRYWVCNRTDLEDWEGHNLKNVRGKIKVSGANYNLLKSEAPSADAFHANTTWFRMRLCDGLEKYLSAQPAYTDWHNNLKLSNNTPPTDYAGLWCVVGDEENGYKIYNRAWGPAYALTTTEDEENARTYMTAADDAVSYDIVQEEDSYKYYVKVHGVTNKYLNDRDGYLATWNTSYALGNEGSVMSFETVNEEVFEANTVTVENELKKLWAPWTGDGANPDINTAYGKNSTFASWVLGRQQLAELLNGKVFKFVNKGDVNRKGRALGVITVGEEKFMGGVTPNNTLNGYLQLFNNNDGTYKLFHVGTNNYFQTPSKQTITENANEASAYTYEIYQDEKQALHFVSGEEHMHLGEGGNSFKILNWGGIDDSNSRWDVIYNADAQELAEILARARAEQARVTTDGYKTNYPGFATEDAIDNLTTQISNTPEQSDFRTAITQLKATISNLLSPGFFTFKYTDDLYLNDDRKNQSETQRTLKEKDEVKSLFYYNNEKTLVGYASGNGFLYGVCNATSIKTAAEYNTFTFEPSTQEVEKFFVKSGSGEGFNDIYANDYYFKVNQDCIDRTINPSEYATWTIEAVTELPVKLNKADDGYAYATLYTPVALTINEGVEAYTGVVSADGNYLQLSEPLSGVIPAGTAVVLKTKNEVEKGDIYNFAITTSDATADTDNVLKGDIFTTSRGEATYYSLNNADGIGFYKYVGANLTGFRARISGEDADVTKLTFRFGNPTGIEGITSALQNEVVYDLSGRRVATPKKGLYIVNGKKVFIK